jgi:polysaccharide export outer membrane protein
MKKNHLPGIFILLSLIIALSSCISQKQIAYFQKAPNQSDTISIARAYVPRIQQGDLLSITVGSLNPVASSFFNPFSTMPIGIDNAQSQTLQNGSISPSLAQVAAPGYLVDAMGNIELPLLGTIKVAGLTTSDTKDIIKNKLKLYLKEPMVNVRFLNYKISVMGEVLHPSVYIIPNESITLPEALSLAGDLTIFGKRENVMIIRDLNGKKEFGRVNLNARDLYNSPYYYLHNNDMIYVEPGKGKVAQTDRVYQLLPVILSALSFLTIIIEYSHR